MANLIITYTSAPVDAPRLQIVPIEIGSDAVTEVVAIGGSSVAGALLAAGNRPIVNLMPLANVWIAIGAAPVAVVGAGRYLNANERSHFWCSAGDKVAAIAG